MVTRAAALLSAIETAQLACEEPPSAYEAALQPIESHDILFHPTP